MGWNRHEDMASDSGENRLLRFAALTLLVFTYKNGMECEIVLHIK